MLAVVLAGLAVPLSAWADAPSIVYDGGSRTLTVSGSVEGSDLFDNFKSLMPGDERSQDIGVEVKSIDAPVRLFIKAEVDEQTAEDLSGLTLMATYRDATGERRVKEASVGKLFAEGVQIATFDSADTGTLALELKVPASVGNELADATKQIPWKITVEDDEGEILPTVSSGPARPASPFGLVSTGDRTLALVAGIAVLGLASFAIGVILKRRNR